MSAVLVNPVRKTIVRIHTHECEKPYTSHASCPGTIEQADVTFVCQCACHHRLPLFDTESA
jgi:hypothetical protein